MTTYREYLDALKAGDKITSISNTGWGGQNILTLTVERRTPTQIVMTNGSRFRASDGYKLGGEHRERLPVPAAGKEITAAVAENKRRHLVHVMNEHAWLKEPLETLEAVAKLIEKPPTPE